MSSSRGAHRPCKACGSDATAKHGFTRQGRQRLRCKDCGGTSIDADSLPRSRYPIQVIARSKELRSSGMTLLRITEVLEAEFGVKVPQSTPSRWQSVEV